MQKYIKDFFKSRRKDPTDYIQCERCKQAHCEDVHHLEQSFRGKRQHNPDGSDLIGLCRPCHTWIHAHNTFENRAILLEKVQSIL